MADTYTRVKDVEVNITTAGSVGSAGLGVPLVITGKAETAIAFTKCSDLSEVAQAGFEPETEVYKACAAMLSQNDKPAQIAVCATDSKIANWISSNQDKDFRQVIAVLGESDSTIAEIATAVAATDDKMFFASVASKESLPTTQSDRVVMIVYAGDSEYVDACVVGATAGLDVGSFTYKNIKINGVIPDDLSVSQVETIHNAGAMCILKKAGDVVTSEGKTTSGEYIDVVDSKDYIITNIVYKGQKMLNNSPKLPYDNVGISQLENTVTDVLADAYGKGIIATNEDGTPAYSTSFATRAETSTSDRSERVYNGGKFTFDLAGAIHNAKINGTLVI